MLTRRRFIAVSAAALAGPRAHAAPPVRHWTGSALGARASISLSHSDGAEIARRAFAEIDRLEDIFSLYRSSSALSRLNRDGALDAPPPELLECLGISGAVHRATGGAFDPTVQPLWALHAEAHARGSAPTPGDVRAMLGRVGWGRVSFDARRIVFDAPGMALTLNGIAQGYIADRVVTQLRRDGLTDVLVDTGEIATTGSPPGVDGWPVRLAAADAERSLRDTALASSAPLGTTFDSQGRMGHIIDPRLGVPAASPWRFVSISAPRAAVADALSTAACLMDRPAIDTALQSFRTASLAALLPRKGIVGR